MYRIVVTLLFTSAFVSASILDGDLDLAEGVRLVSVPISNSIEDVEDRGRSFGDHTVLNRLAKFLQGHELQVKLPKLIEKDRVTQIVADSLKIVDESYKTNNGTGRGKGGGAGGVALIGLMFAKALGAAGIGGIGLLTMKALALSALALMMSGIVGVKKLSHHDDHDDHQVIYAGHHGHHRRRRDIPTPLPYQGWSEFRH